MNDVLNDGVLADLTKDNLKLVQRFSRRHWLFFKNKIWNSKVVQFIICSPEAISQNSIRLCFIIIMVIILFVCVMGIVKYTEI